MSYHETGGNPRVRKELLERVTSASANIEEKYRTPGVDSETAKADALRFASYQTAFLMYEGSSDGNFDALDESMRWSKAILMAGTGTWDNLAELLRSHARFLYQGEADREMVRERRGIELQVDADEGAIISYLNLAGSLR